MSEMVYRSGDGPDEYGTVFGTLGWKTFPNLHPNAVDFAAGVRMAEDFMNGTLFRGRDKPMRLFGPKLGFVNHALGYVEISDELAARSNDDADSPLRAQAVADAFYLTLGSANSLNIGGGMIANADCPLVGMRAFRDNEVLGFGIAHCGLANLIPARVKEFAPGVRPTYSSIDAMVAEAFDRIQSHQTPFNELRFFYFGGIGPCCYGFSGDQQDGLLRQIADRYGSVCANSIVNASRSVQYGPHQGKTAVNLAALATENIASLSRLNPKVRFVCDRWDTRCTACYEGSRVLSPYHSNTYSSDLIDGCKPRNITFFGVGRRY